MVGVLLETTSSAWLGRLTSSSGVLSSNVWPWVISLADIALLAFLIYRFLLAIRGTRALQMAVGLAVITLSYPISNKLGLRAVSHVLGYVVQHWFLLVVIVFQSDIRRALMRIGRRTFFSSARTVRESHVIEETVSAAAALAQRRIGALIVFERDASLDEFVQAGTVLQAEVSSDLIYSIFIPSFENPMHDGALIIREGRIWQAGAFLPLTSSPRVDRSLGTRHRAAIGISEDTDAVVLIVSEERGTMSLCFQGNMVRNLDQGSMTEALLGLFGQPQRHRVSKGPKTEASLVSTASETGATNPSNRDTHTDRAESAGSVGDTTAGARSIVSTAGDAKEWL
jgi:diadenylate cyclase